MKEKKNVATTLDAKIIDIYLLNKAVDTYMITLSVPEKFVQQAGPGMFCAFQPKDGHVQRRPFSIANIRTVSTGEYNVDFLVKNVGANTNYFTNNLRIGETLNITYPRGKEIEIKTEIEHYILLAGGIGIAPLIFLIKKLAEDGKRTTVLLGIKDESQLSLGEYLLQDYRCHFEFICEQNNLNKKTGFATDLLKPKLEAINEPTEVVACGPLNMMKVAANICAEKQIPCQVLLESEFACSQGACLGCVVFMVDSSTKHICKDGPAFYTHELDWTKLLQPESEQKKRIASCDKSITLKRSDKTKKIKLNSPVIIASGTQSVYSLTKSYVDISNIGAILTKGLTLKPKKGNEGLRVCETPSGMLNAIGLENMGIDKFLKEDLKMLLGFKKPIIANINGSAINEYAQIAKKLESEEKIVALEINISCPNVKQGGMSFGVDPIMAFEVVKAVRKASSKFLIAKLTPNVTDIVVIGKATVKAGADAISAINTVSGIAIDIHNCRPKLGNITGGLSGPAIKPIGIKAVYSLYKANLGVPIIGIGGITGADDALEYIIAGASAVQIGTASFTDEAIFTKTVDGIEKYMLQHGFSKINMLRGSLNLP